MTHDVLKVAVKNRTKTGTHMQTNMTEPSSGGGAADRVRGRQGKTRLGHHFDVRGLVVLVPAKCHLFSLQVTHDRVQAAQILIEGVVISLCSK